MQRNIVKFEIDVPQVVRLDFSEGKEIPTKSGGKQWQYTLNRDQGIMWLPLAGKQAIERSGARAGDEVRILKTYLNQRTVFTAQIVRSIPAQPVPIAASRPNGNGRGNGNGKAHGFPPSAYHQPQAAYQPNYENDAFAPARGPHQNYYAKPAPAGEPQPVQAVAAEPKQPARVGPASHIAMCLRQAIDAVIDAQEYGRDKGFSVTFLGSDVRAIANSLMIGDQQRGGR
jgi:hypothetical protein